MITIDQLQRICHRTAVEHGWWPMQGSANQAEADVIDMSQVNIPEKLMLMVSELGEALEHYRNGVGMTEAVYYHGAKDTWLTTRERNQLPLSDIEDFVSSKPDGFAVELADCLIRIFDLAGAMNIDMEQVLEVKMNYNKNRPYRHGNKKC